MLHRNILILVLMLLTTSMALAQEPGQISTFGTATIQVAPNQMHWMLTVRAEHHSSSLAAQIHQEQASGVLAFLQSEGFDSSNIQTSGMRLSEIRNRQYGKDELDGYLAVTQVVFTLKDLESYSALWVKLSGLAGVSINGISLDHSERIKFQNEARIKAVLAAREKARDMAMALDLELGFPVLIEEDQQLPAVRRGAASLFANSITPVENPGQIADQLAPGSIPITTRVKAVFQIQASS